MAFAGGAEMELMFQISVNNVIHLKVSFEMSKPLLKLFMGSVLNDEEIDFYGGFKD